MSIGINSIARDRSGQPRPVAGIPQREFDYYVLAISWSPTFCKSPAGQKPEKNSQCKAKLGFVIHGLWPQYNDGGHPESCPSNFKFETDFAEPEVKGVLRMPPGDMGLRKHEWDKHGTCSGLNPREYFKSAQIAAEKIVIPTNLVSPKEPISTNTDNLFKLFQDVNPTMTYDSFEVAINPKGEVSELRICYDKNLNFAKCSGMTHKSGNGVMPKAQ